MTDLTDALHSRRAALHGLIRAHADEIADIDRLLIRHDPTFEPTIDVVLAAAPGLVSHAFRDAFAVARAAMQHDDRPPADVPHVEQVAVDEAGVGPAPDGLPRPPLDTPAPAKRRRRTPAVRVPDPAAPGAALVAAAADTKITPYLQCKHPGCDRTFSTRQSLGGHMARGHRDDPADAPTPLPATPEQPTAANTSASRSPVGMPAERGRVVRCSCGWQTSPSHARDLAKHTVIEHHREPTRDERTPISDERAA